MNSTAALKMLRFLNQESTFKWYTYFVSGYLSAVRILVEQMEGIIKQFVITKSQNCSLHMLQVTA